MVVMTRLHLAVRGVAALSVALGAFGMGASALAADAPGPVLVGRIQGEINPITARYVDRVVSDGEADNATAVVFVIDTPGGLIDSTYQITARFLATRIPIVTFVAPAGAMIPRHQPYVVRPSVDAFSGSSETTTGRRAFRLAACVPAPRPFSPLSLPPAPG